MELVANVRCLSKLSSKFEVSYLLESKLGAGEQAGADELQFETNLATHLIASRSE